MVQALESRMNHRDLPQALILLNEMNSSAQHVATLVDNMIQKVRNGELTTDQGLSFLEVKYNMLLSYLINLTFVVLRKCSGEQIEGDPCIDRLIELRTVLEKIRPIDQKLKYQIDKLVKTAVTGSSADEYSGYKSKPVNFEDDDEEDEPSGESDSENEDGGKDKTDKPKSGVYKPPKLAAVHCPGVESTQEKSKRLQERNKKLAMSSSIMQDLYEEYLDTPVEVAQSSRAQQTMTKEQKEREAYEEEYMTRLPLSKAEKHRSRQLTTLGTLGDEITNFGSEASGSRKRKQKGFKSKKKNVKRRRFH